MCYDVSVFMTDCWGCCGMMRCDMIREGEMLDCGAMMDGDGDGHGAVR